mgnify:CR=1 FL=1
MSRRRGRSGSRARAALTTGIGALALVGAAALAVGVVSVGVARKVIIPPSRREEDVAIRRVDLKKHPSVSETVDWAKVLVLLHANALEESMVRETLSVFLKFEEDIRRVEQEVTTLLHDARAAMMG